MEMYTIAEVFEVMIRGEWQCLFLSYEELQER